MSYKPNRAATALFVSTAEVLWHFIKEHNFPAENAGEFLGRIEHNTKALLRNESIGFAPSGDELKFEEPIVNRASDIIYRWERNASNTLNATKQGFPNA